MSIGLNPGDAILIRFPHSDPPKKKICVCVCVDENIFLVISSKAYAAAPADSQIKIFKKELDLLQYDSYLDASKYYEDFSPKEIERAVLSPGVFSLSKSARDRIKYRIGTQPYLIERVKKKIMNNL
jgi:hypothetical protein